MAHGRSRFLCCCVCPLGRERTPRTIPVGGGGGGRRGFFRPEGLTGEESTTLIGRREAGQTCFCLDERVLVF